MAGGGGSTEQGEPEFQIAPMIDVLLVLLIFFMSITSAEVLNVDKTIHLPVAPEAGEKQKNLIEGALNVKWSAEEQKANKASFAFEGKTYANMEDLVAVIKRHVDKAPAYRIIIRADKDAPAVEIQRAMSVLGNAGLENVAFSAMNK